MESIRENLTNGGYSIGSWMQIPHTSIAEIMGQAGYEWVAVDMEHGAISVHQLPDLFRALELGNTLPLVRVAQGKIKDCKQALDAGAGGIIVPMVENAEQLRQVRDATRWPPSGNRGVGFSRANLFGKHFDEYIAEAQQPLLVAMIEHINAVDELDDILKVEGLDAIMIGPYDLSASMGLTAKFNNQNFIDVIQVIKNKSNRAKIPCGIHIVNPSEDELRKKISDNYNFIAYSIDSVFLHKISVNPFIV
ncbi:MAG: 2,4-dihydroxyhept-2-ene-1,7-dioic acid aldolase [Candidatus Marinimicrobia bacterium]|nr:2,4-dihydroxyhept-2-ene-1,7-dioic acid aldolase [Candidatus Neomarinimicrobiota bacterium]